MKDDFRFFRTGLLICLSLLMPAGSLAFTTSSQGKAQSRKDANAKKREQELKSAYKEWIEEVAYIITDEERRAFRALKTDGSVHSCGSLNRTLREPSLASLPRFKMGNISMIETRLRYKAL